MIATHSFKRSVALGPRINLVEIFLEMSAPFYEPFLAMTAPLLRVDQKRAADRSSSKTRPRPTFLFHFLDIVRENGESTSDEHPFVRQSGVMSHDHSLKPTVATPQNPKEQQRDDCFIGQMFKGPAVWVKGSRMQQRKAWHLRQPGMRGLVPYRP
jgi:hypothetical protein